MIRGLHEDVALENAARRALGQGSEPGALAIVIPLPLDEPVEPIPAIAWAWAAGAVAYCIAAGAFAGWAVALLERVSL